MADSWHIAGAPQLETLVKPLEVSSRFHVSLPGRSGDDAAMRYSGKRYSRVPGLLSLKKKLPPVQLAPAISELPKLPEEAAQPPPSPAPTAAAKVTIAESTELPSLVQGELPKFAVPAPPPKPRNGAVRPARQHERLHGGNARGMRSRAIAHNGFADRAGNMAPSRWSNMKVLYTELVEAINSISIPTLLHSTAQAQVCGAQRWPEYSVAMKRLQVLQSLHAELQEAASGTDIGAIERVLLDASVLKVGPDAAGSKHWAVRRSAESRLTALRRVHDELKSATRGTSILALSVALRSVQEVGVEHWDLSTQAQGRLHFLQSLCTTLNDVANGTSLEALRDAVSSATLFGVSDGTDAPLGPAMAVARKRLMLAEAGGFEWIDMRLSAAADGSDVGALRVAVVEAEVAFADGRVKVEDKTTWQALTRARDRLSALAALEVECLALQSTTLTDNLVAAVARADTLGCSTWALRKEAEDRLSKVRLLESEMLHAVSENSVDLLERVVRNASAAGLSSWPHARAAQKLLEKLASTGQEVHGQVMKQFLDDLSCRLLRCNLPIHDQQNLLHAGLLVRMDEGSCQRDISSLRRGIELAMRAALQVYVDVKRVFQIEPSALVVELLMCPQQADPAQAVHDLQAQLDMDDFTSVLKNSIFGQSVSRRPQLLHAQVVDKFAARALKRHAGTGLGSVASTDSRCSTVSDLASAASFTLEEFSFDTSRQLIDTLCSESELGHDVDSRQLLDSLCSATELGHYADKDWSQSGSCASRSFTPGAAELIERCIDGACTAEAGIGIQACETRSMESLGSFSGFSAPVVNSNASSRSYSSTQLVNGTVEEVLTRAISEHSCLPDYVHEPQGRYQLEAVCVTSELLADALNYLAREESPISDATKAVSGITKTLQEMPCEDIVSQTSGAWAHAATIESVARDAMHQAVDALMRQTPVSELASLVAPTRSPTPWGERLADEAARSLIQKLFEPLGDRLSPEAESLCSFPDLARPNSVLSFVSFRSLEEIVYEAVKDAFENCFEEGRPENVEYLLEVQSVATSTARERIAQDATAHLVRTLFSRVATRAVEYALSESSLSEVVGEEVARGLILDVADDIMGPAKSVSLIDGEDRSSCADAEVAIQAVQQVLDYTWGRTSLEEAQRSPEAVSLVSGSQEGSAMSSFLNREIANVAVGSGFRALDSAADQPMDPEKVVLAPDRGAELDDSDVMLSGIMSPDGLSPTAEGTVGKMIARALDATSVVSAVTEDKTFIEQVQEDVSVQEAIQAAAQQALVSSMADRLALADQHDGQLQVPGRSLTRDVSASMLSGVSSNGAGELGRALVNDASRAALGQAAPTEISDVADSIGFEQEEAGAAAVRNAADDAVSRFARSDSFIAESSCSEAKLADSVLARAVAIYTVRRLVQRARGIDGSRDDFAEQHRPKDELMTTLWRFAKEYISRVSGSNDLADPLLTGGVVCDVLAGAVGHLAWRRVSEAALSNVIGAPAAKSQVSAILGRCNESSNTDVSSWAADVTRSIQRMTPVSAGTDSALGRDVARYAIDTATRSCAQSSIGKILSTPGSYAASGAGTSTAARHASGSERLNPEAEELRLTASSLAKRDGLQEANRTWPGEALSSSAFHSSPDELTDGKI